MKKSNRLLSIFFLSLCMTIVLSVSAFAAGNMSFDQIKVGDTLIVATQHGVNFRKAPSINGVRITTLPTNAIITVKRKVSIVKDWLYVTYGSTNGYVCTSDSDCGNFFSKYDPNAYVYQSMSGYQATSKTSGLNVRTKPNVTSSIVGNLSKGQVVDAVGNTSNGWVKVSYTSGSQKITGFVSGDYVIIAKKVKKIDVNEKTSFSDVYGYVAKAKNSKGLKIYSSANTHSVVVDKLKASDVVYIQKKAKNKCWYSVSYYAHPTDTSEETTQLEKDYVCTGYILASDAKVYDVSKKLTLSSSKISLPVGSSKTLVVKDKYKVYKDISTLGATVTFKSSKKSVATVNAKTGEITAVKKGSAKITATVTIGKGKAKRTRKLTCKVTVKKL